MKRQPLGNPAISIYFNPDWASDITGDLERKRGVSMRTGGEEGEMKIQGEAEVDWIGGPKTVTCINRGETFSRTNRF